MFKPALCTGLFAVSMLLLSGCENAPRNEAAKESLSSDAKAALTRMEAKDSGLRNLIDSSYGYVIFPSVGKGGFIVGASHGRGEVYEQGRLIGYAEINQASVGAQAGGEDFAELIVFKDKWALQRFTAGNYSLGANVSAVALKAGASGAAVFKDGLAVFTMPNGGLMVDISVAGQKFGYQPLGNTTTRPSYQSNTQTENNYENR